jgi:hypothetical protein
MTANNAVFAVSQEYAPITRSNDNQTLATKIHCHLARMIHQENTAIVTFFNDKVSASNISHLLDELLVFSAGKNEIFWINGRGLYVIVGTGNGR